MRFHRLIGAMHIAMAPVGIVSIGLSVWLMSVAVVADDQLVSADQITTAVKRALPLLETGSQGSLTQRPQCFTCHNQGLPVMALRAARDHGLSIDEVNFRQQVESIAKFLEKNNERFRTGKGTGGEVATAGYALWALDAGKWKPDGSTDAVADYLLQFQREEDGLKIWKMTSDRPPSEHSHFTANYLALRGLVHYATAAQGDRKTERFTQAKEWLLKTSPVDTEDRVFRLWSLHLLECDEATLSRDGEELLKLQRDDGGWAQNSEMSSDAYATGSALSVLLETGRLSAKDPRYQKGVAFLVRSQSDDGSWYVKSRSKPFQTYFESGFPHGKDQFISITAAGWATIALVNAVQRD